MQLAGPGVNAPFRGGSAGQEFRWMVTREQGWIVYNSKKIIPATA